MSTDDSSARSQPSGMMFGSGLSGMIAAYISARAQEDNAAADDSWHAQLAFRPRARAKADRAKGASVSCDVLNNS
ncbi:hypothetical protein EYS21_22845 [Arthrobacter sp. S39]|nr:hypothetical protein EYS21_22845 [Arthrobacter sp. S39]